MIAAHPCEALVLQSQPQAPTKFTWVMALCDQLCGGKGEGEGEGNWDMANVRHKECTEQGLSGNRENGQQGFICLGGLVSIILVGDCHICCVQVVMSAMCVRVRLCTYQHVYVRQNSASLPTVSYKF